MYTLVELQRGALPWDAEKDRQKIQELKENIGLDVLLQVRVGGKALCGESNFPCQLD